MESRVEDANLANNMKIDQPLAVKLSEFDDYNTLQEGRPQSSRLDSAFDAAKQQKSVLLGVVGLAGILLAGGFLTRRSVPKSRFETVRRGVDSFLHDAGDAAKQHFKQSSSQVQKVSQDAQEAAAEASGKVVQMSRNGLESVTTFANNNSYLLGIGALSAVLSAGATYFAARRSSRTYEEMSYQELYQRARKLEIAGRSGMNKEELIKTLGNREA